MAYPSQAFISPRPWTLGLCLFLAVPTLAEPTTPEPTATPHPTQPPHANPGDTTAVPPNNDNGTEFDPDARPALNWQVTPELSFGGKLNLELKTLQNKDLADSVPDRQTLFINEFTLAALYQPADSIEFFGEGRVSYQEPFESQANTRNEETELEFREGFVLFKSLFQDAVSLQVGRQKFDDGHREWFFDDRLDGVRLIIDQSPWTAELSISSTIIDAVGKEDDIVNYIASLTYRYGRKNKEKLTLYGIAREDSGKSDRNPKYVGLSWSARPAKRQKLWLDTAVLFGTEKSRDLLSYGLNLGWSRRFKHPLKPSITLGFAYGSGDSNTKDGDDHNFQQTDLQDNSDKFNGNTSFRYYGEVLDPELSNMMIFTAGIGLYPTKTTSVDLVYHYYTLVELTDELRDAGVDEDLTGLDHDLGHELDLIIGMKLAQNIRASFVAGSFFPGEAFPTDDPALTAKFKLQVSF